MTKSLTTRAWSLSRARLLLPPFRILLFNKDNSLKTIMYIGICSSTCAKAVPGGHTGNDTHTRPDRTAHETAPQHGQSGPWTRR